MPTRDSDPGCNSKKMHIGNDFVTIVYNDSQQAVKFGRIKVRFSLRRRDCADAPWAYHAIFPPSRSEVVRDDHNNEKVEANLGVARV